MGKEGCLEEEDENEEEEIREDDTRDGRGCSSRMVLLLMREWLDGWSISDENEVTSEDDDNDDADDNDDGACSLDWRTG